MKDNSSIGIVVIGRNEGERLNKCLSSCLGQAESIVYVDSGSTDGSVKLAESLGIEVIILDPTLPFSAARARNEGVKRLLALNSSLTYVQFVDGDCEMIVDWLSEAKAKLDKDITIAIVCGRLRERFPESSIYNRICDTEWNSPSGEVTACGGLFMIRLDIFNEIGGFNSTIIAGEEPELCLRVRRIGKKIFRLPNEMAWHDANMRYFSQWWKRMIRSGHAYAQGAAMYGRDPERYCIRESFGIWLWSIVVPSIIGLLTVYLSVFSMFLLLIYPYKIFRIARWATHLSERQGDRWLYACVCVLAKWPELLGQLKYWGNRALGKKTLLIEHK